MVRRVGRITRRFDGLRGVVRWFFGVPMRGQTYRNLAYLLLAFPLGITYFVLYTVGVALGIGLAILLVGFVVLGVTFFLALGLLSFERILTNWLLDTHIETQSDLNGESIRSWVREIGGNRRTWTALVHLPFKFVLGIVAFVLVFIGLSTSFGMVVVPLFYDRPGLYVGFVSDRAPEIHQTIYLGWNYMLVGFEAAFALGYWEIETLPQALLVSVLGVLLALITLHACNGLARLWGRFATFMMSGSFDPLAAVVTGTKGEGSRKRS